MPFSKRAWPSATPKGWTSLLGLRATGRDMSDNGQDSATAKDPPAEGEELVVEAETAAGRDDRVDHLAEHVPARIGVRGLCLEDTGTENEPR